MSHPHFACLLLVPFVADSAHAQITTEATTVSPASVAASWAAFFEFDDVPAGTDITGGLGLEAVVPGARGDVTFLLTGGTGSVLPEFRAAIGTSDLNQGSAASAASDFAITVSSAMPRNVTISAVFFADSQGACQGQMSTSLELEGHAPESPTINPGLSIAFYSYPAILAPDGLTIDVDASGGGDGACSASWEVTFADRAGCVQYYGSACDAWLTGDDAAATAPGEFVVELHDPTQPDLGVLLLGVQALALPTPWNCDLLVASFASIPMTFAPGAATSTLTFPTTEVPVDLRFQGATAKVATGAIHLTNGMVLAPCP